MNPDEIIEVAEDNLPLKYEVEGLQNRTNVLLNNLVKIFHDSCLGLHKKKNGERDDGDDSDNAGSVELGVRSSEDLACVFVVSDTVNNLMLERNYGCVIGSTTFKGGDFPTVDVEFECFDGEAVLADSF